MKIECPFRGCNGIIDLEEEFNDWPTMGRTAWLEHSIMCRKCNNFIGGMYLGASVSTSLSNTKRDYSFSNPLTKKEVKLKTEVIPDKYLKDWAKIKKVKKDLERER